MKKSKSAEEEKPATPAGGEQNIPHKKHGPASGGDSSRTQKGDPAQKGKGKQEGRK